MKKELLTPSKLNDVKKNLELRKVSGNISTKNQLVSFLYLLMRDELSTGKVEKMVRQIEEDVTVLYTNGWLAQYSIYLAESLQGKEEDKNNEQSM